MAGLNEHHKRRILSTLQYADKLLADGLRVVAPSSRSLFSLYVDDISPAQYHWVEDYAGKIREQMGRLLERFEIERHPTTILSSWTLRTSLISLDIALEDIYPETFGPAFAGSNSFGRHHNTPAGAPRQD